MSEANLWDALKGAMELNEHGWHASRVESHATSAGIPDVDYCYFGDGHIELKHGSATTKMPEIRDTQIRWMLSRASVGGKVYILTQLVDGMNVQYLWHRGQFAMHLHNNRGYEYWFNNRINDNYWSLDPDELHVILSGARG